MEWPRGFAERMARLLGQEREAFFQALSQEPCRALRIHPQRISEEEFKRVMGECLEEPIPFAKGAFRFSMEGIGALPWHHGGAVYVQEPAAMAPVAALPEKRRFGRILDLCAAPGGKSLQAASLLEEGGFLVSNEPNPVRRRALMQNVERWGEKHILVSGVDATDLPSEWKGQFDLVLCDAPCSGEGMMRKHDSVREEWSQERIDSLAALQEQILSQAAEALAPGGILLYSTCTWSLEENEEQIHRFLSCRKGWRLLAPAPQVLPFGKKGISLPHSPFDLSLTLRFYPHLFRGEGQFLAILEKPAEAERTPDLAPAAKKAVREKKKGKEQGGDALAVAEAFLRDCLTEPPAETLLCRGEEVFLAPVHPFSPSLFVSPGVLLGTVQKGRILPHHRFFQAYAPLFRRKLRLSAQDPRVEAFLAGEELACDGENGWTAVFLENCPLGGIKCSNGRGKNYYPKGLRKSR